METDKRARDIARDGHFDPESADLSLRSIALCPPCSNFPVRPPEKQRPTADRGLRFLWAPHACGLAQLFRNRLYSRDCDFGIKTPSRRFHGGIRSVAGQHDSKGEQSMRFPCRVDPSAIGILPTIVLATAIGIGSACAQIASFSVGADNPTTINTADPLTTFPDEHVTFMPLVGGGYLLFGSSGVKSSSTGGAVVLNTQDGVTFNFPTALGFNEQLMTPPVPFGSCNSTYDSEFDENYVGPGSVLPDPTLPPGNLIMIYEAENHCPGGVNQFEYYATSGLARSSDNGKTWPAPIAAPLGGPNRYPALSGPTPEPTNPNSMNLGNAIPSALVDGDYLYIVYENAEAAGTVLRIARANLITDNVGGTLQFHKWYNGSFSQPGIGGLDTLPLPSLARSVCFGRQGSLAHDDDLDLYILIFLCTNGPKGQAGWYYSTTASLDTEVWTAPELITGSLGPWQIPCPETGVRGNGTQFDGFYPSIVSLDPTLPVGHIHNTGRIYFLDGCDAGTATSGQRDFNYRDFTIIGGPSPVGTSPPVSTHDFNGDGKSDVLWRDAAGDIGSWLANGSTILTTGVLGSVTANWSVVGQRDFNGDGFADILWRDTAGNVGMWLMNGNKVASASVLGNVPTNWSVAGTGDFNGDGYGDILWRDTSGNVGIWFMKGTTVQQSAIVGNVPTNWTIAGADMRGDIFWRNTMTGEVGMWVMAGTSVAQSVDFGIVPLTWKIAGIGDFDGNGSTDILWRDTSGDVGIWLLNGTTILSTAMLGNVPLNWTIAQTGDYNGDRDSDILWTDSAGDVGAWSMNGTTISSTAGYGNVGSGWTVQSLNAE